MEKIGTDLDDIIAGCTNNFIKFYNQKTGSSFLYENWHSHNFWEVVGGTREGAIKLVDEFYNSEFFDNMNLIEGAQEGISKLSKNNEISIITARPFRYGGKTNEFFQKYFPKTDLKVFHSRNEYGEKLDKGDLCQDLGIRLMVEDNKDCALSCAEKNIKVLLLDKPWNRDGELHENIVRVNNWNEILGNLNIS